jgi:uncharacterized delta-60 repeat protein/RHS repeat-associated protein
MAMTTVGTQTFIVVAGQSNSPGDTIGVTEYNLDGTVNTSFGTQGIVTTSTGSGKNVGGSANAMVVLSSGNILVAGYGYDSNGDQQAVLVEYNSDGSLDTSFGNDGIVILSLGYPSEANAVTVLGDGSILVTGSETESNGYQDIVLAELTDTGSLDTSFGANASGIVTEQIGAYSSGNAISAPSNGDGPIIVAGKGTDANGYSEMAVLEFNSDGTLDTSFGDGGIATEEVGESSQVNSVVVESSGTIVAVGWGTDAATGHREMALVGFDASDGSVDTSFGTDGIATLLVGTASNGMAAAIDANGTILVAGRANEFAVAAFNGDGSLDTSFGNGVVITNLGSDRANAIALQSDGQVVVTGETSASSMVLARFNDTNSDSLPMTYDNNGNTLTDQAGFTYTYDAWNRMVTATPPASFQFGNTYHEEYYTYNALGEQVTVLDGIQNNVGPVLVINDGNVQRSMIDSLTVVFDQPVTLSAGAFTLTGAPTTTLTVSIDWSNPSGDDKTFLISFTDSGQLSNGSLPNDIYTLTIDHSDVSYIGGGGPSSDVTFTFDRLEGDFNGDGVVNNADQVYVSDNYDTDTTSSDWFVDMNDDGVINFSDLLIIAQQSGSSYTYTPTGPILIGASTTEGASSNIIQSLAGLSPRDLYYSSQWQVIQEDANNPVTGTMQTADQYVWGIAYVNELVLRDSDADGSSSTGNLGISGSGLEQRVYALQDANYNVTALVADVNGSWIVVQRFSYDPYGNVTILNASGATTADGYDWIYLYQGGRFNAVTKLYTFENRQYRPATGTWTTQDPAGYVDGANLYQAFGSNPVSHFDPSGTDAEAAGGGAAGAGEGGGNGFVPLAGVPIGLPIKIVGQGEKTGVAASALFGREAACLQCQESEPTSGCKGTWSGGSAITVEIPSHHIPSWLNWPPISWINVIWPTFASYVPKCKRVNGHLYTTVLQADGKTQSWVSCNG